MHALSESSARLASGPTGRLVDLATRCSADEFAARFPCLFFVYHVRHGTHMPISFVFRPPLALCDSIGELQVHAVTSRSARAGQSITVGRCNDCDIIMQHPSISRCHARIRARADGWCTIEDCGSKNGTFIAGQTIGGAPQPLRAGHLLLLGVISVHVFDSASLHRCLLVLACKG